MTNALPLVAIGLLVMGLACSGSDNDIEVDPLGDAAATEYQVRYAMWQEFCRQEPDCKIIHENLMVLASENFAASHGLKQGVDGCADVVMTRSGGAEEVRHYIVIRDANNHWQVGEQIQIESCFEADQ